MSSVIYLDNAASVRPFPEAVEFYRDISLRFFANQESAHSMAYDVRKKLEEASAELLSSFGHGSDSHVFWTSSGTDSINSVLSLAMFNGGNIVTTAAEHPALLAAVKRSGAEIRTLKLLPDGGIDVADLERLIDKNTSLVAVHHVQGETGRIQPLEKIREVMDKAQTKALLLADTVQSACKMEVPWGNARLDFMLVSGHKIGAGAGGAVVCRGKKLYNQLKDLRSKHYLFGRPSVAYALSLACAAKLSVSRIEENTGHIKELNSVLREKLSKLAVFTLDDSASSPYIAHFTLSGFQGAVIVRMLSEKGIMISSGSACASETNTPSRALTAMGMTREKAFSALRISFHHSNSINEIDKLADALNETVKQY